MKSLIEKNSKIEFTAEHEKELPRFIQKWREVIKRPLNKLVATKLMGEFYEFSDARAPKVYYARSPFEAFRMHLLLDEMTESIGATYNRVKAPNKQDVEYADTKWVRRFDFEDNNAVYESLCKQMGLSMDDPQVKLSISVIESLSEKELDRRYDLYKDRQYYPQWVLTWACLYEYANWVGIEFPEEEYNRYIHIAQNIDWFLAHEDFVICSERGQYNMDDNFKLHGDGQYAMWWEDGSGVYYRHGDPIKAKYGARHSSQWDPMWMIEEQNSAVKVMLIEQIGMDKFVEAVGLKPIDQKVLFKGIMSEMEFADTVQSSGGVQYELLEGSVEPFGRLLYLKMKNPSEEDVWHYEGIDPDAGIRTVEQALAWRNPFNTVPLNKVKTEEDLQIQFVA